MADRGWLLRAASLLCVAGLRERPGGTGPTHKLVGPSRESALRQRTDCVSGGEGRTRHSGLPPRGRGRGEARREREWAGLVPAWPLLGGDRPAPKSGCFGTVREVGTPLAPRLTFPREPGVSHSLGQPVSSPGFVLSSLEKSSCVPFLVVVLAWRAFRRVLTSLYTPLPYTHHIYAAGLLFENGRN